MRKLIPFIVIIFVACTSNLHPVSQNDGIVSVTNERSDNCIVYFKWLGNEGKVMVFDVQIKNTSTENIYVDPAHFSYAASTRFPALYTITPLYPHPLTEVDVSRGIRAKIRSKDTFKFLIGALTAGLQAYNGLLFTEGIFGSVLASDLLTTTASFAGEIGTSALDSSQERLKDDLKYVPSEILKRTRIYPGESVQGKVFFELIPRMKYYEFKILIEGDLFTFSFHK